MTTNMGQIDRIIRAIAGAVLIYLFFTVASAWGWLFLVVGIVLLATAAVGYCPPYHLLGISTRKSGS